MVDILCHFQDFIKETELIKNHYLCVYNCPFHNIFVNKSPIFTDLGMKAIPSKVTLSVILRNFLPPKNETSKNK